MQVKFYASLRQAAGIKMIDVPLEADATVKDVLVEVTHQYPVLEKFIWKEEGGLSDHAHVFINGENLNHVGGLEARLVEQDHMDIFPPLVGG